MRRLITLILAIVMMPMIYSCGESKAEKAARIEQEKRIAEQNKREEEQRKREEELRKWEASDVGKGWNYLRKHLKSPSTAELVNYAEPNVEACRDLATRIDLPGLSIAMYEVDAQNGFGAMIRSKYLVFFKYGQPMHIEDADQIMRTDPSPRLMRMTLQVNGY